MAGTGGSEIHIHRSHRSWRVGDSNFLSEIGEQEEEFACRDGQKTLKERALRAYGAGRLPHGSGSGSGSGSQGETEDRKCSRKPVWVAANCSTGRGGTSTVLDDVSMLS